MITSEAAPRGHRPTESIPAPPTRSELLRVASLHARVKGKCRECGAACTKQRPLCAIAADALRQLAVTATGRSTRTFAHLDTMALRRLAGEHRPDAQGSRCIRCGLAYLPASGTKPSRQCPTLREIQREMGIRSRTTTVPPGVARGTAVCTGRSELWKADRNNADEWAVAVAACQACPVLMSCRRTLDEQLATGSAPVSMIVAGKLLNAAGEVVDDLRKHARQRNAYAGRLCKNAETDRPTQVAA